LLLVLLLLLLSLLSAVVAWWWRQSPSSSLPVATRDVGHADLEHWRVLESADQPGRRDSFPSRMSPDPSR